MSYLSTERSPSSQWPGGHPLDPRGSTTIVYRGAKTTDSDVYRVGVYGWRKRCLYVMIILLSVFIVINMALTIWIVRVLHFTPDGMGSLKIIDGGIRVTGRSEFEHPIHFRNLATAGGTPLSLESDGSVVMSARNKTGHITAQLTIGSDGRLTAKCNRFEIRNNDNDLLFFTDKDEVAVKVENLRIIGDGGSVFEGAVQTEVIRPEADRSLRLESPTRGLEVQAAQDIELLSRAGDIQATTLLDIKLESTRGEMHLNSPNMFISGLRQGSDTGRPQYQICLCENGRLFLANSGVDCRADASICS